MTEQQGESIQEDTLQVPVGMCVGKDPKTQQAIVATTGQAIQSIGRIPTDGTCLFPMGIPGRVDLNKWKTLGDEEGPGEGYGAIAMILHSAHTLGITPPPNFLFTLGQVFYKERKIEEVRLGGFILVKNEDPPHDDDMFMVGILDEKTGKIRKPTKQDDIKTPILRPWGTPSPPQISVTSESILELDEKDKGRTHFSAVVVESGFPIRDGSMSSQLVHRVIMAWDLTANQPIVVAPAIVVPPVQNETPTKADSVPFYGVVPSNMYQDQGVREILGKMPRTYGLFKKWSKLPLVNKEAEKLAQDIFEQEGLEGLRKAGGRLNQKTGKPVLNPDSPRYGELLQSLVLRHKGFIREVPGGTRGATFPREEASWLLRLSSGDYLGFSLSWQGQAGPLFAEYWDDLKKRIAATKKDGPLLFPDMDEKRQEWMDNMSNSLVIWERGTQLLWFLQALAWEQRSSYVCFPDITLGQIFWRGDRNEWPKDWHQQIEQVLDNLRLLEFRNWTIGPNSVLRSGTSVWQAVTGYDPPFWKPPDPDQTTAREFAEKQDGKSAPTDCPDSCRLKGRGVPHHHYIVGLAPNFQGVLNAFKQKQESREAIPMAKGDVNKILYDWSADLDKETKQGLKGKQSFVTVDAMPGMLLNASWADITTTQKALLHALLGEITRHPKSERTDYAMIFKGGKVRIASGTNRVCPHLDQAVDYVCFGGNGKRPGGGYTIGGTANGRRGGWMAKGEYWDIKSGPRGSKKAMIQFLLDLCVLMKLMNGVAVCTMKDKWLTLGEVEALASSGSWKDALRVKVRPYVPSNYTELLEEHVKEWGGFNAIPRNQDELDQAIRQKTVDQGGMLLEDLKLELAKKRIPQKDFAKALGVSAAFLSMVLNGKKPFNPDLQKNAKRTIEAWAS